MIFDCKSTRVLFLFFLIHFVGLVHWIGIVNTYTIPSSHINYKTQNRWNNFSKHLHLHFTNNNNNNNCHPQQQHENFVIQGSRKAQRRNTVRLSVPLYAKKPSPSSWFDLDAIEAFEIQLDKANGKDNNVFYNSLDNDDNNNKNNNNNNDMEDDDNEDLSSLLHARVHDETDVTIPTELDQIRIDAALAQLLHISRSNAGAMISEGCVSVTISNTDETKNQNNINNTDTTTINNNDNRKQKQMVNTNNTQILDRKSYKVSMGQILHVKHPATINPSHIQPQSIPLDVLYEDQHMIVLNKAAGMVVHPAAGNWDGTIVNALLYYFNHDSPFGVGECFDETTNTTHTDPDTNTTGNSSSSTDNSIRPGIVHRLDKGTTGVLIVGKTIHAMTILSEQFANRTVQKMYLAITLGNPGTNVSINKPIGRHPIHRQRMRVVPTHAAAAGSSGNSRSALSHVNTLAFDGKLGLVQVVIATGRTHQIRVHLQDRHTPIYGDDVYGRADWNRRLKQQHGIERPMLHAYEVRLKHPITGQSMVFRAPLAPDMMQIAQTIDPNVVSLMLFEDATSMTTIPRK